MEIAQHNKTRARRFFISGRVQGVSFRFYTQRKALELQLSGYAKNLPDGRVEVVAQGLIEALETLALWLKQGSPFAQVELVEMQDCPVHETVGFVIC